MKLLDRSISVNVRTAKRRLFSFIHKKVELPNPLHYCFAKAQIVCMDSIQRQMMIFPFGSLGY